MLNARVAPWAKSVRRVRWGVVAATATAVLGASATNLHAEQRPGPLAGPASSSTFIPCAGAFDPNIGPYGDTVFALLRRPKQCIEYLHKRVDHADEVDMQGVRWRAWGAATATGTANSHYCNMGSCINRPASLSAFRRQRACGRHVYTRLREALPPSSANGFSLPRYQTTFYLPACGGPYPLRSNVIGPVHIRRRAADPFDRDRDLAAPCSRGRKARNGMC